jgi:hypothetical protein
MNEESMAICRQELKQYKVMEQLMPLLGAISVKEAPQEHSGSRKHLKTSHGPNSFSRADPYVRAVVARALVYMPISEISNKFIPTGIAGSLVEWIAEASVESHEKRRIFDGSQPIDCDLYHVAKLIKGIARVKECALFIYKNRGIQRMIDLLALEVSKEKRIRHEDTEIAALLEAIMSVLARLQGDANVEATFGKCLSLSHYQTLVAAISDSSFGHRTSACWILVLVLGVGGVADVLVKSDAIEALVQCINETLDARPAAAAGLPYPNILKYAIRGLFKLFSEEAGAFTLPPFFLPDRRTTPHPQPIPSNFLTADGTQDSRICVCEEVTL